AWQADSGQVLLSFDDGVPVTPADDAVEPSGPIALRARGPASLAGGCADDVRDAPAVVDGAAEEGDEGAPPTADDFFQLGCSLESGAADAARAAYERALALKPTHVDAHVNLGRLLHEMDELRL